MPWDTNQTNDSRNQPSVAVFPEYVTNASYRSSEKVLELSTWKPLQYWYSWEHDFMNVVQPKKPDAGTLSTGARISFSFTRAKFL